MTHQTKLRLGLHHPTTYQEDGSAVFAYKSGFWMAKAIASLNFPDSLKLSLSLDLATIAENQVAKALSMLNEFSNPHFALKISEVDDEFILSATVVVSGEPKNYQLAIGIAINDVLSVSDSLLASFAKLKGTESLMNY